MDKPKAFLFYGISGSGKGTQAKLLIDYLKKIDPARDVIYIETGARIREYIDDNAGYTRDIVKDVLEKGGLLPEFIPIWLWAHLLVDRFTGKENLVLDGVSRRPHESPVIDGALKFYGFDKLTVILLKVSRDWARARLKSRGRYDDDDSEIERRFDWFGNNTVPAIEYFKSSGSSNYFEVSGEGSVEEVHNEILRTVGLLE